MRPFCVNFWKSMGSGVPVGPFLGRKARVIRIEFGRHT
jgi:acetylornithine/succinyldiaminopimelate/putrescine aminotransferase